eukprot:Gb_34930 [translate_table: standard]
MAAQRVAGAFVRGEVGGAPCSSQQIHTHSASSSSYSASTLPSLLGSSPPSFHYQGLHSHSHSQGELGSSFFSRKGRQWAWEAGTGHSRGYRDVGVNAVASLGGLLGGLFKGNDTAEATRQQYAGAVNAVNTLEAKVSQLSDDELRSKTAEFKERVAGGESLDSLLSLWLGSLDGLLSDADFRRHYISPMLPPACHFPISTPYMSILPGHTLNVCHGHALEPECIRDDVLARSFSLSTNPS